MPLSTDQSRTGLLYDQDQGWQSFAGTVRVRYNPIAGALQLQVSVDNGNGTFSVSTFVLDGALRDTRVTNTQWPAGQN